MLQGVQAQYGCCFRGLLEFLELQGLLAVAAPGLTADLALANINNVRGLPYVTCCAVCPPTVLTPEHHNSHHHAITLLSAGLRCRWHLAGGHVPR